MFYFFLVLSSHVHSLTEDPSSERLTAQEADKKKEPKGYLVNKLWTEKFSFLAVLSESITPVSST